MMKIVCGILLILLYVKEGASLKCFACIHSDAEAGTNCDTTYSSNFLVDCLPSQNYCEILYGTATVGGRAVRSIFRGCSSSGISTCSSFMTSNCRKTCTTDGCNSNPGTDIANLPAGSVAGSLKCYTCYYNSVYGDNSCQGPSVANNFLVSCLPGQNYCQKATTTASGISVVVRGCSTETADTCVRASSVKVCTKGCSTDGCNDGNGIQATRVVIFIALLISFAFSAF